MLLASTAGRGRRSRGRPARASRPPSDLADVAQPLGHHAAGGRRNVDPDPLPARFSAATSAVPQPQKASSTMSFGLLLSFDDAFEKGERLLRWVAEALCCACELMGRMSSHTCSSGTPLHFVEVALAAVALRRASAVRRRPSSYSFFHLLFAVAPIPRLTPRNFVVSGCPSMVRRRRVRCQVAEPIASTGSWFDVPVVVAQRSLWSYGRVLAVESVLVAAACRRKWCRGLGRSALNLASRRCARLCASR